MVLPACWLPGGIKKDLAPPPSSLIRTAICPRRHRPPPAVLLFRLRPSGSAVGRNLPGQEFTARLCSVSGWGWEMAQLFRVFEEPQEMPRIGFSCIWFLTSEPPYCQDRAHHS